MTANFRQKLSFFLLFFVVVVVLVSFWFRAVRGPLGSNWIRTWCGVGNSNFPEGSLSSFRLLLLSLLLLSEESPVSN